MIDTYPRSETGCPWCGSTPCEPLCLGSHSVAGPHDRRGTSWLCLKQIREEGLLSRARLIVYETLIERGPLTGRELEQLLAAPGQARGSMHKRLPELERAGVARVGPARRCAVTGRMAVTWEAVDRLPVEDRRTPHVCPTCGHRSRRAA